MHKGAFIIAYMQSIGRLVGEAMYAQGASQASTAARADVAASTIHRIKRGEVEPSVATVEEILAAIGVELALGTRPMSDGTAATAARAMLEDGYEPHDGLGTRWLARLERWCGDDPIAIMTEAGRASNLWDRPGVVGLLGPCTLGRLASAGQASGQRWAVSGASGLRLGRFNDIAAAPAVFRCEDVVEATRLLADGRLRPTHVIRAATVLLVDNDADALVGAFDHEGIQYAAPIQIMLDCISLGGDAAAGALEEIATW